MAMHSEHRAAERGLSLVEALVIVTLSALIALLLLPLLSRATGRNAALADRMLGDAEFANAERDFRALLHAVDQPPAGARVAAIEGDGRQIRFTPDLPAPAACGSPGDAQSIRMRIATRAGAGRLLCETAGKSTEIVRWKAGQARFSYSLDGVQWAPTPPAPPNSRGGEAPPTYVAPLVRFELIGAGGRDLVWIERAGWTEAANVVATGDAAPASTP